MKVLLDNWSLFENSAWGGRTLRSQGIWPVPVLPVRNSHWTAREDTGKKKTEIRTDHGITASVME
jgi:hypothetical protein